MRVFWKAYNLGRAATYKFGTRPHYNSKFCPLSPPPQKLFRISSPWFWTNCTYPILENKDFWKAYTLESATRPPSSWPHWGPHCSTLKKQRYPILKSQRLQKKFAPPGKSTQTALQNIEKGKISHIKKPEASKEVRPSWKKHPKGRYHTRTVDPFCNKSHPKEEISNTCCRPSHAWNKHPKGRYHTRIVDPFCCKSHPKEEISNKCCRPFLD